MASRCVAHSDRGRHRRKCPSGISPGTHLSSVWTSSERASCPRIDLLSHHKRSPFRLARPCVSRLDITLKVCYGKHHCWKRISMFNSTDWRDYAVTDGMHAAEAARTLAARATAWRRSRRIGGGFYGGGFCEDGESGGSGGGNATRVGASPSTYRRNRSLRVPRQACGGCSTGAKVEQNRG